MENIIKNGNDMLNQWIWGPGMLLLFLMIGAWFTLQTGIFQVRKARLWMRLTLLACFRERNVRKTKDTQAISQFQSFCTALAASLGTGNITGVATALVAGGPGAIFWMWVSSFLGMMTTYAENVLGIRYRYKNEKGEWIGGAMVYMERGLHCKWLAVLFAVFCLLASFGMGNMTQANAMATGLEKTYSISPFHTGIILMVIAALVLLGGVKRIAAVTEKVVPLMALFYMIGGGIILAVYAKKIPNALYVIVREAFQVKAVGAGTLGYGMRQAMKVGISRGIFSNEAGLGSSVMAHSQSDVQEPAVQGMWGIAEVFVDTIVVCTVTALVILTSGVYQPHGAIDGSVLAGAAFATVIPKGDCFLTVAIVLFAFATIIGWAYYGERTIAYLWGERAVFPYKICYIMMLLPGCVTTPTLIWEIADTFNGFMALPNLVAVVLLSKEVLYLTKK